MRFLSPLSLAWLGLLVPLVLLYVLKRRRDEKKVASTMLWEQALEDLRAESPFKRLMPNLLLLLQALAIIFAAVALARPVGVGGVPDGAQIAVVIDTSASMAATHGDGTTRLAQAKRRVRDLIDGLPPGGALMIVSAGGEPVVTRALSRDRDALFSALDALEVEGGGSDLEEAVAVSSERLRDAPSGSRVVVLTDRAADGSIDLAATVPLTLISVVDEGGREPENTAIVSADAHPRATEESPDRTELFLRVARFGATPADVFVTARVEGRGLVASRRVTIAAGETESILMTADLPPDPDGRAAVLTFAIESDATDDLALDDLAVIPSPAARRVPVFLVGDAPSSVRRVFRADRGVELYATSLERLAQREEPLTGLVVYAGEVPSEPPPGPSMVIAPTEDAVFGATLAAAVEQPEIIQWAETDDALRFVSFADVHLRSARPIESSSVTSLAELRSGPVIARQVRSDGETTLVSFDPDQTDWPRRPSFVVFFRNVLESARQRLREGGVAASALGQPLRVPVAEGAEVEVVSPSGRRYTAVSRGGLAVVDVDAVAGVFQVDADGRSLHALRNLLNPEESELRPRLEIAEHGEELVARASGATTPRESWPYFVFALLLLIAIEAFVSTRRA